MFGVSDIHSVTDISIKAPVEKGLIDLFLRAFISFGLLKIPFLYKVIIHIRKKEKRCN